MGSSRSGTACCWRESGSVASASGRTGVLVCLAAWAAGRSRPVARFRFTLPAAELEGSPGHQGGACQARAAPAPPPGHREGARGAGLAGRADTPHPGPSERARHRASPKGGMRACAVPRAVLQRGAHPRTQPRMRARARSQSRRNRATETLAVGAGPRRARPAAGRTPPLSCGVRACAVAAMYPPGVHAGSCSSGSELPASSGSSSRVTGDQ